MTNQRGYFGIGIFNIKTPQNIGTLYRTASIFGASFIFTIGKRYKQQGTDTIKSWRHIPLFNYETLEDFKRATPYSCKVVGIELHESAKQLSTYKHPERAVYLLGAEDNGLSNEALSICHDIIQLPGDMCLNVSVAGSIAIYDRICKCQQ